MKAAELAEEKIIPNKIRTSNVRMGRITRKIINIHLLLRHLKVEFLTF